MENEYGVHLCHGLPTKAGFFYDSFFGKDIFTEKIAQILKKQRKKLLMINNLLKD